MKVRTEVRLKRIARSSLEESEFVWAVCQTMTQEPVRKTDKKWTERDSENQECFSCVVVRCGRDERAKTRHDSLERFTD